MTFSYTPAYNPTANQGITTLECINTTLGPVWKFVTLSNLFSSGTNTSLKVI